MKNSRTVASDRSWLPRPREALVDLRFVDAGFGLVSGPAARHSLVSLRAAESSTTNATSRAKELTNATSRAKELTTVTRQRPGLTTVTMPLPERWRMRKRPVMPER